MASDVEAQRLPYPLQGTSKKTEVSLMRGDCVLQLLSICGIPGIYLSEVADWPSEERNNLIGHHAINFVQPPKSNSSTPVAVSPGFVKQLQMCYLVPVY